MTWRIRPNQESRIQNQESRIPYPPKPPHRIRNVLQRALIEFGVHGQRDNFFGEQIGIRQKVDVVGGGAAEGFLIVEGDGVVDHGGDAGGFEVFLQGIAAATVDTEGVLVEDVGAVGQAGGREQSGEPLKVSVVPVSGGVAPRGVTVQAGKLAVEHGGLDGVEAAVTADDVVVVAAALPVVRRFTKFYGELFGVGVHRAAVTVGAEVLAGVEAGGADVADGAGPGLAAVGESVGGTDGLGVVFHDVDAVFFGEGHDGLHVAALPVEVDGDDGLGALRDGGLYVFRTHVESAGVYIYHYRCEAEQGDDLSRSDVGEGGDDDLVTGLQAEGHERDL